MNKPHHLFFLLGLTSMISQILLMRELVVVFYGNELSLGIMLGSWLFWVAMGSVLGGFVLARLQVLSRSLMIAAIQAALGFFPLATLLSIRALPSHLHNAVVGEVVGYGPIVIFSFAVVAPLCLMLGFLFTLFCHAWADRNAASSINSVYFIEGAGAAAGGIMFALLLAKFVAPVETALLLLVLNLAASASVLLSRRRMLAIVSALAIIVCLSAGGAILGVAANVEQRSLSRLWSGLHVAESENSIYGNVTFIQDEEQKSLYENGLLIDSYPDRFSAEESVHFALLEQPEPKRVLLIGGAGTGSLSEALKHPIARIDYIELDPLIIRMLRRNFPREVTDALDDPRVGVHNTDGRLFLKQTAECYDVVIVNLPDPYTAQVNRFYTKEFFELCRSRMTRAGVLSFRVSSSETYISPELQQFIGCIYQTLADVFADVKVIPGENNIFLASQTEGILTVDADVLLERLNERKMKDKVLFIREYYLPFRLSEQQRQLLSEALAIKTVRRNTDFSPVCYYYDAVLWSKQFKDFSSRFLQFFSRLSPVLLSASVGGVIAIAAICQIFFRRSRRRLAILFAVGATGFAGITMEMVILLAFQALYGYVYHKLAIIISCFMIGLAFGALLIGRIEHLEKPRNRAFLTIQTLVSLYPLLLLGALLLMADTANLGANLLFAGAVFPGLAFLAGMVGGLQFPLANALWLVEKPGVARAAGYMYGIDLFGSCLGAMITTALLVPLFGIPFACVIASFLSFGSLLVLALARIGS